MKSKQNDEAVKALQDALNKVDWNEFWAKVEEKVAPQIEAYRRARIRSYANAHKYVFY